ncbi:hypothetical protein [Micromonospora chokoriensis]|uniref:hypothetical protein n=1 Tax=Micromonospora chokoriensis TaxID=356851 RepID=UPI00068B3C76|nr:hypothetical protein [Micromonospora chokoriensis]
MAAVGYGTDHEPESELEPAGDAAPRRWSTGTRLLAGAAAVVLLLGAAAVAVIVADPDRLGMTYSGAPGNIRPDNIRPDGSRPDGSRPDGSRPDGSRPNGDGARPGDGGRPGGVADPEAAGGRPGGAGAAAEQLSTAPLAGRQRGVFVLADGLSSFELRVAELGDDLYRISTPAGSGVVGRPAVQGETVRLDLVESGTPGSRAVRVLLNERVAWRLQLAGGVSSQVLDLTRARLLGVELAGGSTRTEILLPPITAASTLTVRLSGGSSQLDVRVPGEISVRVRVGAGAGSVVVRDDRWDGVAAGSVLGTPGWDRAAERLYLDLVAGANSVMVSSNNR